MLVSHDRALLRSVCDEFWLVARGRLAPFAGDLDDYQRFLLEEARRNRDALRERTKAAAKPSPSVAAAGPSAKLALSTLKALARQQLVVEQTLHRLQTQQRTLEERLPATVQATELAEIGRELQQLADEISAREEEWLALAEQIDQAENAAAALGDPIAARRQVRGSP